MTYTRSSSTGKRASTSAHTSLMSTWPRPTYHVDVPRPAGRHHDGLAVLAEVLEHAGDHRAGGVGVAAPPVQPPLQRQRLAGRDRLGEEDAVVLVDAVEALLPGDLLRRGEDAVVVAGAGRPRLGGAGGEGVEVDVDGELVDRRRRAGRAPGACRTTSAPARSVRKATLATVSAPSAPSRPAASARRGRGDGPRSDARDRRLDGVRPAGRVGGHGAGGQLGDRAGGEVGVPAAVAGEEEGGVGRRSCAGRCRSGTARSASVGAVGVGQHEHAGRCRVGQRRRAGEERDRCRPTPPPAPRGGRRRRPGRGRRTARCPARPRTPGAPTWLATSSLMICSMRYVSATDSWSGPSVASRSASSPPSAP